MALKRYDLSRLKNWHAHKQGQSQIIEFINNEAKGGTFIFFHGRWQGGSLARRLANALGPDHRFISIGPHGMHGEAVPTSFEKMALDRVEMIRAAQPSGPYRLGGHCNGALVAYEAARLLRAAGEKVECVVLVEPPTVNARPFMRFVYHALSGAGRILAGHSERSRAWVIHMMELIWDCGEFALTRRSWKRQAEVVRKVSRERVFPFLSRRLPFKRSASAHNGTPARGYFELEERNNPVWRQYYEVAVVYMPQPLDVSTVLFTSNSNIHGERSFTFNGAAWRHIDPAVEIVPLPGNHVTSMALGCGTIAAYLKTMSQGRAVVSQDRALDPDGAHEGPCAA